MLRRLAGRVIALLFCAGIGVHPVLASSVVVPEQLPTVQQGIDSGADTVLIRQGDYSERPVVDHALVLRGTGITQRPRLLGLEIYNTNFWAIPPLLSVSGVTFLGAVHHTTVTVAPRNLQFTFADCSLDSGFIQSLSTDPDDVQLLSFQTCRMSDSNARAYSVVMESDTVDGGVAWRSLAPKVEHCLFRGGNGTGIQLTDGPNAERIAYNQVSDYPRGIYVEGANPYIVEHNLLLRCGTGIGLTSGFQVEVVGNAVKECGIGMSVDGIDYLNLISNTVIGSREQGIVISGTGLTAQSNVVGRSGSDGIAVAYPCGALLKRNTIFRNGGAGITTTLPDGCPAVIKENISFENAQWGLASVGVAVDLGCNDWFGNSWGATSGVTPDATDLNVDPKFCGVDSGDVRLDSSSPLAADSASCGEIGALGVGCGTTAAVVQRFTAGRVSNGVRVVWEVAEVAAASAIWVERAEGLSSQAWTQPVMERSTDGRAVVELDRSALRDRAYRYRLMAQDGGKVTVLDPGIVVEAEARLSFGLDEVGPSPGSEPVRIAFTLGHDAAIHIDVFDLLGRRVATLAQGEWSAGTQVVNWDGQTRDGQLAPSGMYVVRYTFPGGQDRRRIMRVR
jgi:hypothetical protein